MPQQIHLSLDDPAAIEYEVQQRLGVSVHALLRTLLRMFLAGDILVTREDIRRHNGKRAS